MTHGDSSTRPHSSLSCSTPRATVLAFILTRLHHLYRLQFPRVRHPITTMAWLKFAVLMGILLSSCLAVALATDYEKVLEEWDDFKLQYNREYDDINDSFRFKVFLANNVKIADHNELANAGEESFFMRMNQFGDLHKDDFSDKCYLHHLKADSQHDGLFMSPKDVNVPSAIDWREYNVVTSVKNQGQCGSCWSFSATGALEGQHSRNAGRLVSLSEQNLIDCSKKYGNKGCNGGLMDYAFKYIKENHGIDTESGYPYEASEGDCRYVEEYTGATDYGFIDVPRGNETKLMEAVATVGPVSVAIDASQMSFMLYGSGIYDEPECNSTNLDHAVLVVGYGTDEGTNKDFWLVKNSWGDQWGENGYIRMVRNKGNQCGIASSASYPLV